MMRRVFYEELGTGIPVINLTGKPVLVHHNNMIIEFSVPYINEPVEVTRGSKVSELCSDRFKVPIAHEEWIADGTLIYSPGTFYLVPVRYVDMIRARYGSRPLSDLLYTPISEEGQDVYTHLVSAV
jgi:hypothetical protein